MAGFVKEPNLLEDYRDLILLRLAQVGLVLYTPFNINQFLEQKWVLGFTSLAINGFLLVNALAISRRKPPPLSPIWLAVLMLLAEMIGIKVQAEKGLCWHYPCLVFLFLVLNRRPAVLTTMTMTLTLSAWITYHLGWQLGYRLLATGIMTSLLTDVFIGNIKHLQGHLEAQVLRDPLTGAYNRRHMDVCLKKAMARRERYEVPWSVVSLDIDHFKRINDELGHDAGDQALRGLVETLSARLRKLDVLFRAGGEEFVILLESTRGAEALKLAEELCAAVAATPILSQRPVTISLGVAELQADDTLSSWLKRADERLYEAKSQGRNRAVM